MNNPIKDKKYSKGIDRGGDFEYPAPNSKVKLRQGTEVYSKYDILGFRIVRNAS